MLVRPECGGEINGAIDSTGGVIFVCQNCHEAWTMTAGALGREHDKYWLTDQRQRWEALAKLHPEWVGEKT